MRLFSDQVNSLLDTYQSKGVKIGVSRAIEAVGQAYRRIGSCLRWSYLHRRTQINTVAPYSASTVTYVASTRILTLAAGTFPTWAQYGVILLNGNIYSVQQRLSATTLLLQSDRSPVDNISSATTYSLFRIEYILPANFVRTEELVPIGQWWGMQERNPGTILQTSRLFASPSRPFEFVVHGSLTTQGRMCIEFGPPPDAAYTLDLTYYAQPRPRTLPNAYSTGSVSVSNTTVTGSGTAFTSAMVGCQLRQGTANSPPVGEFGVQGSLIENTIISVESATSLTLADSGGTSSGVQYIIDDPVDIERGAMDEVFQRFCESQFEISCHMDKRAEKEAEAMAALARARAMDVRLSPRQQSGGNGITGPSVDAMIYSGLNH